MRVSSRLVFRGLLAASFCWCAEGAIAGAVPVAALASDAHSGAGASGSIQTGGRWYADDYFDDPPAYYPPPPAYRYAPPAPPAVYSPPVYGWSYVPPPPPSSCGAYRYWNGEYCADARDEPPYIGPRW